MGTIKQERNALIIALKDKVPQELLKQHKGIYVGQHINTSEETTERKTRDV